MTEELKQKAEEYTNTHGTMVMGCEENLDATELMQQAYIAGAKENGVIWHDLRKDSNDLPPKLDKNSNCSERLYVQYGGKYGNTDFAYYNFIENKWQRYENAENVKDKVIAWCEIPQFKE